MQLFLEVPHRNLNKLNSTLNEQNTILNPLPKEFDLMLPPKLSYCTFKKANNNGVAQTVRMCRLFCTFADGIQQNQVFS